MNRSTIPNLPKRVLALVLAAALLTPSAFASAGTAQINTAQTLADGLVYRNTVSNHSSAGRMESFALELEPDNTGARALYARMGFQPLGYAQMIFPQKSPLDGEDPL